MVDLEKIRIFYHVMKEGNLSAASKVLDKGIGTISKHLKDLEESLNKKLYIRKYQRFDLTPEGRDLFSIVQNTIPLIEETIKRYYDSDEENSNITILTTTGITGIWLIKKIYQFSQKYPKIIIKIITTNENADFKNSKANIGLLPKVNSLEGLLQKKILTVYSKLFASQEYLLKRGVPNTLEDLNQHDLISYYSDYKGTRGDVDWHLTKNNTKGFQRHCRLTINSAFIQIEAARQGLGIVAAADTDNYIKSYGLMEVLPSEQIPIDVYLLTRTTDIHNSSIKNFINFLSIKVD